MCHKLKYVSIRRTRIVDLKWVNIRVLTAFVGEPKFTKSKCLLFDAGENVVHNDINHLSIAPSVPEIFKAKLKSCPKSWRILDVFRLHKF